MEDYVTRNFGGRIRLRACGILVDQDRILLAKHKGIGELDLLWSPPGGEVQFGETIAECLVREFREETGLKIQVQSFLTIHEFIQSPFHAVEVFYLVKKIGGSLIVGHDPELNKNEQMISDVRFVTFNELEIMPTKVKHKLLKNLKNIKDLVSITTPMIKFQ